jgi:acetylornithine deacetylase
MTTTSDILARLIAFPTISKDPNRALIDYVRELLASHGISATLIPNMDGTKANLYASVGGKDGGVMLSGHTDVVPIEGQTWTRPAFELTRRDRRYYGRGTADMKGFCAAAIHAMIRAGKRDLKSPLHLALSYDEEIGCVGVGSLIGMLEAAPHRPAMCIVGEPTGLAVATGHKGKLFLRATCTGIEGHSALAPMALNALHLAVDFVNEVRAKQADIEQHGIRDGDYDVPYTTLHVGRISGGVALNIVPNLAVVEFEIRNLAQDDPQVFVADLQAAATRIAAQTGRAEAAIAIEQRHSYPGLLTPTDARVVNFIKSLTGANGTIKVAFGTEGGLFSGQLGIPTVVCGPGSMMQGHKPDEYVSVEQMQRCDSMLDSLLERLSRGL